MNRPALVAELKKQIAANPRLKLALPIIALLATLLVWQEVDGLRIAAGKAATEARARTEQIKALRGQDEWLARQAETKAVRDALWAELPIVETPGLAQAAIQSRLRTMVRSLGETRGSRIVVAEASPVENFPGLVRVRATVSGGMSPTKALMLLQKIESATNLTIVETLSIRSDKNQNASATLSAYYRLAPAETSP